MPDWSEQYLMAKKALSTAESAATMMDANKELAALLEAIAALREWVVICANRM